MAKLYNSREWLFHKYAVQKKSIEEIAKEANCTTQTIYVKLREFKLN
jgi:transposase